MAESSRSVSLVVLWCLIFHYLSSDYQKLVEDIIFIVVLIVDSMQIPLMLFKCVNYGV